MRTKTCPKCGEEKAIDDFYFQRRTCKPCVREHQQRFRDADPDYNRNRNLQRRYGIDVEEYRNLIADHNFACGICKVEIPETIAYKGKRSGVVDHNHETGDIRGILCQKCNLVLGHARENTDILYRAIVYLSERGAYTPKRQV
jgi:hypothetical protein